MTLGILVLYIGIAAVLLTLITAFYFKKREHIALSFLQNYAGALFIFSGWVKAVDPLGTAYKMEQYFAEFETTFSETWLSSIAPLFPTLNEYSIGFSVFMIILEIVLGVMLVFGAFRKTTAITFFLIVLFFTFLTGFTYLTGYVPSGVNFFDFSNWTVYTASNMKVTDCGCFGDFLKLEPRVSFYKDLVLMVPAVIFLIAHRKMHQLFNDKFRNITLISLTILLFFYCLSNYSWDLPHADFRPFKVGNNVAAIKTAEEEAAANVEIIGWIMTNEESGETVEVPNPDYMEVVKSYPKENGWSVEDQLKTKPAIEKTKISDFEVVDSAGDDVTDLILNNAGSHVMVVSHKIPYYGTYEEKVTVYDTIYDYDTVTVEGPGDLLLVERISEILEREEIIEKRNWDSEIISRMKEIVNPFLKEASQAGMDIYYVTAYDDEAQLEDFKQKIEGFYPIYQADDILLKTIIRSNPGVVMWKNGTIVNKWHHKKLPKFSEALTQ